MLRRDGGDDNIIERPQRRVMNFMTEDIGNLIAREVGDRGQGTG